MWDDRVCSVSSLYFFLSASGENFRDVPRIFFQINSKIMTNYPHCGEIGFNMFTHNSNCSYHHRRRWWQHSSGLLLQNFWSVFRRFLTFNGQNSEGPFLERSFKMEFSVLLIYVMTCVQNVVQMKNMQKGKKFSAANQCNKISDAFTVLSKCANSAV